MNLNQIIEIKTRYARSINLERDIENEKAIEGYILTETGKDALARIERATKENKVSAFTITGVYGSGKSAFALLVTSLFSKNKTVQNAAKRAIRRTKVFPSFTIAFTTARWEPIEVTISRAIANLPLASKDVAENLQQVAEKSPIFLIIDELGLAVEQARGTRSSLNLLQRIAEMPVKNPVIILGLLHQSFGSYTEGTEKQEWHKIQGRFEDIPFAHRAQDVLQVIAGAMGRKKIKGRGEEIEEYERFKSTLEKQAVAWASALTEIPAMSSVDTTLLAALYPLHPISALLLPSLSSRYAQNERTLFSFLSSYEPHSLRIFLEEEQSENFPLLLLPQLYDYFLESAGMSGRAGFSRFLEIEERLESVGKQNQETIAALKSIGVINLSGVKASKEIVILSLITDPSSKKEREEIQKLLDSLVRRQVLLYRRVTDEYRIYEGSDFDIEAALKTNTIRSEESLEQILNSVFPLPPVVARRHSYKKGVLRYFHRAFWNNHSTEILDPGEADGLLLISLSGEVELPRTIKLKKPVLLVSPRDPKTLRDIAAEFISLTSIASDPELGADRVALSEIKKRIEISREFLHNEMESRFLDTENFILHNNPLNHQPGNFNEWLSLVLDKKYKKSPVLWNELIHRNRLSTQAAKARRMLAEAMVQNYSSEKFAIEGYGPEATISESLFIRSGLYQEVEPGKWAFVEPPENKEARKNFADEQNNVTNLFLHMIFLMKSSADAARALLSLYEELSQPPYGAREGILPLLFLASVLYLRDRISLYERGTFIPEIKSSHIELLLKRPEFFSIRYFQIFEVHSRYFSALSTMFSKESEASLLATVKPFIRFYAKLSVYSKQTSSVSETARNLREAIANAREPERFLFEYLPMAAGENPIDQETKSINIDALRKKIHAALFELQEAYTSLITTVISRFLSAFNISQSESLEKDLANFRIIVTGQSLHLLSRKVLNPEVTALARTFSEKNGDNKEWITKAAMVVADKPPENWKDQDISAFEVKLSETAAAFQRLHFLLNDPSHKTATVFESFLVTLTKLDGRESKQILSYTKTNIEKDLKIVRLKLEEAFSDIARSHEVKKALLRELAEELLAGPVSEFEKKEDIIQPNKTKGDAG